MAAAWSVLLPTEVWQIVFGYLPCVAARKCLSVSHFFHDLAAPLLFATVRIEFGCWKAGYGLIEKPPGGSSERRTCCILLRIITDHVFASYIKHLHVLAFSGGDRALELCLLTKAVNALRNLHTFRWYTTHKLCMIPDTALLETLTSSCIRLREYALPLQCADALSALKNVSAHSLNIHALPQDTLWHSRMVGHIYGPHRRPFVALLEAHSGALVQLSIPGTAVWDCPAHILSNLSHLEIHGAGDLAHVVEHCAQLKSLHISFRDAISKANEASATLAENPTALPNLTHLKLRFTPPAECLEGLLRFIGLKKNLRCLDWNDQCFTNMDLSPLLSVLPSLSELEVLGIDLRMNEILDDFAHFKHSVPKRVTALRLCLVYGFHQQPLPEGRSWTEMWECLPDLAFLSINDDEGDPIAKTCDLVAPARSLQFVAHRENLCEVFRTNQDPVLSPPWSHTKAMFRSVDDFGCEDWEWLMRGHSYALLEELSRGSS
ncbi:hypothetical protein DAEQUDRAFT_814798 [Daedalea quercina L-15889]|uniref:F-box domain-containing protein n=1 Tax=Daedalea quercina L-15889 TaxID=1314783 RepID=A0A165LR21_9APHY|nr:hypothetical protein DAEQUDRAFT_814798 [Daedalea quercina L-15889]